MDLILVLYLDCLDRRCLGTVDAATLRNSLGQTLAVPRMFLTLDPPVEVQTLDSYSAHQSMMAFITSAISAHPAAPQL